MASFVHNVVRSIGEVVLAAETMAASQLFVQLLLYKSYLLRLEHKL